MVIDDFIGHGTPATGQGTPMPSNAAEEGAGMPIVLQIVGAIASFLLSQYTAYDDSHIREMLRDIAYNVNLALQKLDEIAVQIGKLGDAIAALPEQEYKIAHSEQLVALNKVIQGALIRFEDVSQRHKTAEDNALIKDVLMAIYHDVSKARSELEAYSEDSAVEFAPLAAAVAPLALLLELGLGSTA